MRAAPRPKSVREPNEVRLVNGVQDRDDGALDQLVLQRGNPERSLPPIRLRDVRPPDGLRPIRSPREAGHEVLEICFQRLPVVPPRLAVHTWGRVSLEREIGVPQSLDSRHVVQKRGEPLLPVPSCCLTYSLERAGRAGPALRPGRDTLERVALGQLPSLHHLRGRSLGVVRWLPRYCGAVRLPAVVRHRRGSWDFPMRSAAPSATDDRRLSRFPCEMVPPVHGVSGRARSPHVSRWRRRGYGLPPPAKASAPRGSVNNFAAPWPAQAYPCQRFTAALTSSGA